MCSCRPCAPRLLCGVRIPISVDWLRNWQTLYLPQITLVKLSREKKRTCTALFISQDDPVDRAFVPWDTGPKLHSWRVLWINVSWSPKPLPTVGSSLRHCTTLVSNASSNTYARSYVFVHSFCDSKYFPRSDCSGHMSDRVRCCFYVVDCTLVKSVKILHRLQLTWVDLS